MIFEVLRGTQYDIDNKDEDEGEVLKEDNNVNGEDKEDNKEEDNDQFNKCHNFSKSQDRDLGFLQGPQYDDDDGDEDEDEEVKEVKEDNDDKV